MFMKDYVIYKDGKVWSNIKKKFLAPYKDKRGYKRVDLIINGERKTFLLHRLVAQAFILNPENKPCIDHIDGNPENNRVENLRWVTHKENNNNYITRIRAKRNHKSPLKGKFGADNPLSKIVICYSNNMSLITEYKGIREASRKTGINRSSIIQCCNGLRKTAGGYIWKIKD